VQLLEKARVESAMKPIQLTLITAFALALSLGGLVQAQTDEPGHPRVNEVNQREVNQQNRINQGIKSGQLTPQETSHLETREANLQSTEAKDEAKHNGHLTKAEQRNLNHRENKISRSIYRKKHNAKTD
jgi:hypothetical protein